MLKRNRLRYFVLTVVVMITGLLSRQYSYLLPEWLNSYLGDVLWAMMIFLGIATLLNKLSLKKIVILSLLFCYCVEFSQLYHAPWVDSIRQTTLGHLVLGDTFVWSDLLAYTLGILLGALFTNFINNK